ncbi:AraC family transcriptional regulator [uncultured Roseobacter sp.]|uniref:helix-turn-helix domain-containing protein n=1 Tax=uncultured Roseobacter sp. TaxID=114847 RepID=UPI0026108ABD|nr:AraC family transcriptional regulator [uncultured Roseobacter sp.]
MDTPGLFSFPLPLLTALLCGVISVLTWRLNLGVRRASATFSVLFALCALEAVLVAVRFGYGQTTFIPLQRALPMFLGPLMYLGFSAMKLSRQPFRGAVAVHIGAPILLMALFWIFVDDLRALDIVISTSYVFYIGSLFLLWRRGADALIHARVELTSSLSNWILRCIGFLAFILLLDTIIALDFAMNRGANVTTLISYGAAALIVVLLAMILALPRLLGGRLEGARHLPQTTEPQDPEIERRLDAVMRDHQLFLDPELTVQRLARRLHLPARNVSAAINRMKRKNVSQYINELRLAHAANLLVNGEQSVKDIAEASGFMTRSNFYREFQRVYGQSPTDYRNTGSSSSALAGDRGSSEN